MLMSEKEKERIDSEKEAARITNEKEDARIKKNCECNILSLSWWLMVAAVFLTGFLASRGVRYKKHAVYAGIAALVAFFILPIVFGGSLPILIIIGVLALGYVLGRHFDAKKEPLNSKGNELRWSQV